MIIGENKTPTSHILNQKEDIKMARYNYFSNTDPKALAKELSSFYNRQGRIGNHPGYAKMFVYEDGTIVATVPLNGNVEDDGRQIDDIEERKDFFIGYASSQADFDDGINAFLKEHEEGYSVSAPYQEAVGNHLFIFISATKIVPISDDWDDEYDYDEDNDEDEDYDDEKSELDSEAVSAQVLTDLGLDAPQAAHTCSSNQPTDACASCPKAAIPPVPQPTSAVADDTAIEDLPWE